MPTVGYSGTPLAKKLGVKAGSTVVLVHAPDGCAAELEPLPDGVEIVEEAVEGADVAVLFVTTRAELEACFLRVGEALPPAGGLWIAWPKKSSKVPTDLTEDVLREVVLPTGWVDNKVCAVTDVWSGLRFVRSLSRR